jgi:serine O-acetyltransferase
MNVAQQSQQWLWQQLLKEAKEQAEREPVLASFFHASILNHKTLASALAHHIAAQLGSDAAPALLIQEVFDEALAEEPELVEQVCADLQAYYDRDPACDQYSLPFLYFKGFQALQAYRIAHYLWQNQRYELALFLQNAIAVKFDVDIHPAAKIGRGIMIDHATGVVIGETAVIGDNVSLLHSVTLGGSGCSHGDRHPKVGNGVLISTGAKLLGNIHIGDGAKIAAGSLVLADVAAHTTVAGVPARIVGRPQEEQPALDMNQQINET